MPVCCRTGACRATTGSANGWRTGTGSSRRSCRTRGLSRAEPGDCVAMASTTAVGSCSTARRSERFAVPMCRMSSICRRPPWRKAIGSRSFSICRRAGWGSSGVRRRSGSGRRASTTRGTGSRAWCNLGFGTGSSWMSSRAPRSRIFVVWPTLTREKVPASCRFAATLPETRRHACTCCWSEAARWFARQLSQPLNLLKA